MIVDEFVLMVCFVFVREVMECVVVVVWCIEVVWIVGVFIWMVGDFGLVEDLV